MSNKGFRHENCYRIRKECFLLVRKIRKSCDQSSKKLFKKNPRHFTLDPRQYNLDPRARHSTIDPRQKPTLENQLFS